MKIDDDFFDGMEEAELIDFSIHTTLISAILEVFIMFRDDTDEIKAIYYVNKNKLYDFFRNFDKEKVDAALKSLVRDQTLVIFEFKEKLFYGFK